MKKILAFLLVAVMVFSLAACSNNADPSESNNPSQSDDGFLNRDDGSEDNSSDEKSDGKNDAVDPMTRLLNSAGVEFDAIKPDETTFAHTFSESDKKIVFYMESNTETNTAAYLKKTFLNSTLPVRGGRAVGVPSVISDCASMTSKMRSAEARARTY